MKLSKLLFVLVGIGATSVVIAGTCVGEIAKPSCKKIGKVLSLSNDDCKKYFEVSNGVAYQCKQGKNTPCIKDMKATCEQPPTQ